MSKKLISLVIAGIFALVAVITVFCIVSESHTHSYSDEWSHDSEKHWHNATCVHLSERKDEAKHTFDSGIQTPATYDAAGYITYTCTVCKYQYNEQNQEQLIHNYSQEWSCDNISHWHNCTDEGYEELKADLGAHTDSNEKIINEATDTETGLAEYTCEVCKHVYEKIIYVSVSILQEPTVESKTVYVGQPLSVLSLLGGDASVEGTFSWANPDEIITGTGEYSYMFTPSESNLYETKTGTLLVTAEQFIVTVSAGENGSANPTGEVNVNYGASFTVTFTPDSGYAVDCITVDGTQISARLQYTLTDITENHEISVTFIEAENLPFEIICVSGTPDCYSVAENTVTFNQLSVDSVYAISGTLDGNIVIDVGENYKFDLEMRGFTLTSPDTNAVTVLSGNKVSLTAKSGYENFIYDTREAIDTTDETLYSATVYSMVDLEICGKGSLTVQSDNNNGIHTKDDLQVKNLTLNVKCKDNALKGNDSVQIENGTLTLIATVGDCIKTTNSHINQTTLNQKGTVYIAGGTHMLYAACDGIDAAYNVEVSGAATVLNISTDRYSDYSEEVTQASESVYYIRYSSQNYKYSVKYYNSDSDILWVNPEYYTSGQSGKNTYYYYSFAKKSGYSKLAVYMYSSSQTQEQDGTYHYCTDYMSLNDSSDTIAISNRMGSLSYEWTNYTESSTGNMGGAQDAGNTDKGTYSTKGIKSANDILINAGTVNVEAYDDAIHAGDSDMITAGTALENGAIPTGHLTINGGVVTAYSHDDGIHAEGTLTITGGEIRVKNSYEGVEGLNIVISGGDISVVSSDDGFNGTAESGSAITISGGTVYVYSGGDGIDSNSTTTNGAILFKGGNTVVVCNSNGNSAIDTEKGYSHTGGNVVAIMSSGGMTSEATKGSYISQTTQSLSLSSGAYLTVTTSSALVATVKIPVAMSAFVVYLGSASATIASTTSSSASFDANGVCWNS